MNVCFKESGRVSIPSIVFNFTEEKSESENRRDTNIYSLTIEFYTINQPKRWGWSSSPTFCSVVRRGKFLSETEYIHIWFIGKVSFLIRPSHAISYRLVVRGFPWILQNSNLPIIPADRWLISFCYQLTGFWWFGQKNTNKQTNITNRNKLLKIMHFQSNEMTWQFVRWLWAYFHIILANCKSSN